MVTARRETTVSRRRREFSFDGPAAGSPRTATGRDQKEVPVLKLHSDRAAGGYRITAYGAGYVVINEERIRGSVVVTPERVIRDWGPESFSEMAVESFEILDGLEIDIAVLGTGATQQFPDADIIGWLGQRGIGLEIMDTAAACRTYNILMAEGRTVAAMLLPIQS